MPVKECQKDGKDGYKWGDDGFCYTGPNAYRKAAEHGRAIKSSESKSKQRLIDKFGKK